MSDYRDPSLDVDARVEDLLNRMTLEEMIMQTDQYFTNDFASYDELGDATNVDMDRLHALLKGHSCGSIQLRGMTAAQANLVQRYAVEQTRLGIPFLFSEEALHGLGNRHATSFPQQLGLAATFNPSLGEKMGHAIATEARAKGIHETYSPVLDLARDPRYGRTEETYGEDTHLGADFARSVVRGMQGDDLSAPDAVASEPKHYAAYGAPVGGINCAPCAMGRHEIFTDALPIFEAAIRDSGAVDVMCSYSALDGVPVSADHELLTDVLRGQWGMRGFVRTDLTAAARLYDNHFVASTRKEAMAMALEAGVDLQLYDFPHDEWQNGLRELVEEGRLDKSVIRQAAGRVLKVKFMLGLFDSPYTDETREALVHSEAHVSLARQIARESVVLLKNENGLLPLSKDVQTIAVLGPAAGQGMLGDYTPSHKSGISLLEGIRALVSPGTRVLYDEGCHFFGDNPEPFPRGWLLDEEGRPGLTGRYYRGREIQGEPLFTQRDHNIDFNWIMNKPHPDLEAYSYSVRWTGKLVPQESFDGYIGFRTQDSMRLYVDGKLILDGWGDRKEAGRTVPFRFEKGRAHDLQIDFTNDRRGARVVFGHCREKEDFSRAVELAKAADVCVLCMGDSHDTSGENFDRISLDLPGRQPEFVRAVAETGKPIVLVLQTGRPVSLMWEAEHIPAILEAWFPGEQGGMAVAETLFGDNAPSGRLPMSFPKTVGQLPCHYARRPGGGKRYVEMDWLPLYTFGYGLGYTTFSYTGLSLSRDVVSAGESVQATFTVTNTGDRPGTAVPQLYLRDQFASTVKPERTLCAYAKVELQPGESKQVTLDIVPRDMRTLGRDYVWRVEPGDFRVWLAEDAERRLEHRDFRVV